VTLPPTEETLPLPVALLRHVVDVIKRDHPEQEIKVANAEGLKECRQLLKLATLGKYPGYLLEGMACPGGCVAGAGTMQAIKEIPNSGRSVCQRKQTIQFHKRKP